MSLNMFAELEHLKKDLMLMGSLVETAINSALSSLVDRRSDLLEQVIEGDKAIDERETIIEDECHRILCLTQPVASNLRIALCSLKVINELERIGDHAKTIAYAGKAMADADPLPVYDELRNMGQLAKTMVTEALDCLVNQDVDKARQVHASDDEVDDLYHYIYDHISQLMQQDSSTVAVGLKYIDAARNLERVADLATNIAKDVIYLVEGHLVVHRHQRDESNEI